MVIRRDVWSSQQVWPVTNTQKQKFKAVVHWPLIEVSGQRTGNEGNC